VVVEAGRILTALGVCTALDRAASIGTHTAGTAIRVVLAIAPHDTATVVTHLAGRAVDVHRAGRNADAVQRAELP
jgi:hypothetical protein